MVSVIYDETNKEKLAFSDKFLLPSLAVLDPEMTTSMPPGLTASTAMDALTHAIEAYVGTGCSPVSDIFAAGAVELIFKNILQATEKGGDLEARGSLLVAANLAGTAFSHSMAGCVHGMAHAAGALYHVPHGIANAILLPHGMEYNFDEIKKKLTNLTPFMGVEISDLSVEDSAVKTIEAVRSLTVKLNEMGALPLRLRDVGVREEGLPELAEYAVNDGSSWFNPREVVAEELLLHIKNAY